MVASKKIFVTVGTTPFDSLIKKVDSIFCPEHYEVILQVSEDANYIPENFKYFKFDPGFRSKLTDFDLIITHAGAGSIYSLLELGHKIVVVPNLERVDKHQSEIARFVSENNYGGVCLNLSYLKEIVDMSLNASFASYKKEPFFGFSFIDEFVEQSS
ncbi:glycosyltransferase [Vibrio vulnificus]|nr:glycosyltransferase [Vibrio vulnificus]ELR8747414.1 glycosyltransferase [Vibrio vulnificus]